MFGITQRSLLLEKDDVLPCENPRCNQRSRSSNGHSLRQWIVMLLSHTSVFILTFSILNRDSLSRIMPPHALNNENGPSLFSPFSPGIRYTIDKPSRNSWDNQLFMGEPSDESEKAWNSLMRARGIGLKPADAARLNITDSVMLANGNFALLPAVSHNLHCIRRLRQSMYASHYYPNLTQAQSDAYRHHTLHCLEALRTSVMCHPDLTPLRYYWSHVLDHEISVTPDVAQQCVEWNYLTAFLMKFRYNHTDLVRE